MDIAVDTPPTTASSLFKKRAAKSSNRKRPATPPPADDSDSSGYTSASDNGGQRIKRLKKSAVVTANSTTSSNPPTSTDLAPSTFTADRSLQIASTNDATKQSNWFDEADPKALLGSTRQRSKPTPSTDASDRTYKGTSSYPTYTPTNNLNAPPPSKTVGPIRAPTNIRTITVTDFAPDVCKDYKQTGFCGFGDSCKFLHARENYKQGWELDKDWEIGTKGQKNKRRNSRIEQDDGDEDDDDAALLENIPFACIICKKPYINPIVTKCGHYFCEACALRRYRKNPNCAACGAGTGGVFNGAKQLKKLLDRKRERARKRREQAIEDGEEVSDEEGEDADVDA